ncbi:hypothetical protein FA95DRAFT_1501168 [Auriscalpium vulgare]|uniref:Uncharacterized protein n=1 Tax=Auriscalpium vulgare TaxID=40419 RepID=A0ACB8RCQ8_9AGAM|nr:hypothetical protein FA95DRAFT_1501168 [Auriscalpium vulgare]
MEEEQRRLIADARFRVGVKVWDTSQRLIVLRASTPSNKPTNPWINKALMRAASLLCDLPSSFTSNMRGNFKTYWFALHRGSQTDPRLSSYYLKHRAVADEIRMILEGVRQYCASIFKQEAPMLYGRYAEVADWIALKTGHRALFYPFASFAINVGEVCCRRHVDFSNLGPGWCMIVPFGNFDHKRDCRLLVEELGLEFEVAAGVPIWLPSATFHHYNSILVTLGVRFSFAAWTSGSLFQWRDLNGRAVNQLTDAERQEYQERLVDILKDGVKMFTVRSE